MTARTYKIARIAIAVILGIVAAWSVAVNNSVPLVIAVIISILLLISLNKARHEVVQDERTAMLYGRASRMAIAVVLPVAALISVVLILLRERLPHDVVVAAYTLSYGITILMLAQAAFYYYYGRKH